MLRLTLATGLALVVVPVAHSQESRTADIPYFLADYFSTPYRVRAQFAPTSSTRSFVNSFRSSGTYGFSESSGPGVIDLNAPFTGPNGFSFSGSDKFVHTVATDPDLFDMFFGQTSNAFVGMTLPLRESAELTTAVQSQFPTSTYVKGTATTTFVPDRFRDEPPAFDVVYDFLQTIATTVPGAFLVVNVPNPTSVSRNKWFENGSAEIRDRVYVYYVHAHNSTGYARDFDVNRYVFGGEKSLGDFASIEVRLPFAGAASSDQTVGSPLAVDRAELGNLGVAIKVVLLRTDSLVVSSGLGVTLPTADDTRLRWNGTTFVDIRNRATLIQPTFGVAWAPNDFFFAQFGSQLDVDPNGNPVRARVDGQLKRIGVMHDQTWALTNASVGFWAYRSDVPTSLVSRVAATTELQHSSALGRADYARHGAVLVTNSLAGFDTLNVATGLHFYLRSGASISTGLSLPVTSNRYFDWAASVQLNVPF